MHLVFVVLAQTPSPNPSLAPRPPWFLEPVYFAALMTLLATIVGGAIASFSSILVEWKRAKREEKKAKANRLTELTKAARLIAAELSWGCNALRFAQEHKKWPRYKADPIKRDAWPIYEGLMASELSRAEWRILLIAVQRLNEIIAARDEYLADHPRELSANELEVFTNWIKEIEEAGQALASFLDTKNRQHN